MTMDYLNPRAGGWIKNDGITRASYSSLTLHRKCPAAWRYRHVLKLKRDESAPAVERDFGSWWGALRSGEALERGRAADSLLGDPGSFTVTDDGPRIDARTADVSTIRAAAREWWKGRSGIERDAWLEKLGAHLPEHLDRTFERWMDEYGSEALNERPIAVEMFWEREIPTDEGDVRLIGFIDEVYWDEERQMTVIRDYKTSKSLDAATTVDDMMDSQLHLYAWGATPVLDRIGAQRVRAVAYDRTRSTSPKEPVLTATGMLSKSVTLYDRFTYLDWAETDTRPLDDPELDDETRALIEELPPGRFWGKPGEFYKSGTKVGQPKFGVHSIDPAVIERLETPAHRAQFFQRTLVPVSPHLVRSHLRAAVDTVEDAIRTERRGERTGEAARNLTRMGCSWCDFASLCRAQMTGGPDGEYELAEHGLRQSS